MIAIIFILFKLYFLSAWYVECQVGKTALHYAVESGSLEIATLLVQHSSCEVSVKDAEGMTPLLYASIAVSKGVKLVGDKVEGNFIGSGEMYPGKIARDRGDGTYDISYDDGDLKEGVTENKIRLQGSLKTCDCKYQPNYRNINLRRIVEGSHHLLHAGKDYFNDAINELCDIDNICAIISAGKYTIISTKQ